MSDFDAFVKKYEPMLQAMLPEFERHKASILEHNAEEAADRAAVTAEPFDSGVTDENRDEIYAPLAQPAPVLPPFVPEAETPPAPEFKMAPEPGEGAPAALEPANGNPAPAGAQDGQSAASAEGSTIQESGTVVEPPAAAVELPADTEAQADDAPASPGADDKAG
jgi:hypothetical protein